MRIWALLLLMILLSCETVVNPDLPDDSEKLVIYSFFRPDQPINVDVFSSMSILETPAVSQAKGLTIDLFENDNIVESITESTSGNYMSTTVAKPATTYRFEIAFPDGIVMAQDKVPHAIDINEITFTPTIEDVNLGQYGYPASLTFSDPANEENFYAIEVFVDDCTSNCDSDHISGELNELILEDVKVNTSGNTDITIGLGPEGIDGVRYIYLSDNGFNGQTFTVHFYIIPTLIDPDNPTGVTIKYVLKSITEDYYQYLLTSDYQKQIEEDGTLAEPVQIHTNIENGLGVFAAYSMSTRSLTLE